MRSSAVATSKARGTRRVEAPRPRPAATQAEERALWEAGYALVAGVDEVGRGPLAGPVVAAAVVLPDLMDVDEPDLHLVRDSKTLSEKQRERAARVVRRIAVGVSIGEASADAVDEMGIVAATRLAMRRGLDGLPAAPDHLIVDGRARIDWRLTPCMALVKADMLCSAVAAASIVAKVHRDAIMREMDARYPGYGFAAHKGYAAASHLRALERLGPSPIHRRTFSPLRATLLRSDA